MVEGILALGAGRLISLGLSVRDTGKFQRVYFFKCFCPTGSRLLLDIMTTQIKVEDSGQWNSGVQSSMCGFFPH